MSDPTTNDWITAGTISIKGANGDAIEAYLASSQESTPRGSMVVIHHMPGYDRATKEITRRFATMGYAAICPNLHFREAPGASPDDAAAAARAAGGVPDDRLVGDVAGAVDHLRSQDSSNGKVGVIGFCSGGRQSFLAATSLPLDAAIDCYGAFVVGEPPAGMQWKVGPIVDRAATLSCPLLGLFGIEDTHPSPDQVEELAEALREHHKLFEFHLLPDAGHAFFAVDRPAYRQKAAVDGWELIEDFLSRKLAD
jgi:carboxymethylenebutenolidase